MRTCVFATAGALISVAALAAPAEAKPPKPVISGFAARPASVISAANTTVSASVSGAEECTLASNKPVAGLPATFSCEGGSVDRAVAVPANAGTKAAKYKLTLTAIGAGGKAKAKATVQVEPASKTPGSGRLLSAGGDAPCALLSSGHIDCWGENKNGQLGNGSTSNSDTPGEVHGVSDATQVSAGSHTCARLSTGHIDCWGRDENGELGTGSAAPETCGAVGCSTTPVEVQGISNATQVSVGAHDSCAVLSSGHVDCWGEDDLGQLGDGKYGAEHDTDSPVEVDGISNAIQVSAAYDDTCALLSTGHISCWGETSSGQLGDGSTEGPESCFLEFDCSSRPIGVLDIDNAIQVTISGVSPLEHACALLSTDHIDCWGANDYGQLGNGNTENQDAPVEAEGIARGTEVTVAGNDACGLLSTGHLDCWGEDESGQVGDNTDAETVDMPFEAQGVSDATQIASGGGYTCVLLLTGHIDCWGANGQGELGDGGTAHSYAPVEVQGI